MCAFGLISLCVFCVSTCMRDEVMHEHVWLYACVHACTEMPARVFACVYV